MNPTDTQPQTQTPPPQQPPQQSPQNPVKQDNGPISAMQPGESILFDIRRHPIGIIGVYASFSILLLFVAFGVVTAPDILTNFERSMVVNVGLAIFLVSAVLALVFSAIAHTVYYGNRWILTDDSLTQINQYSLFNKQNSQLGLDNLEDVTAEQNGIIPHIFNYGTLRAQTAGEHGKFQFTYCRNPNEYAQKILVARENFEHGNIYKDANSNN